MQAVGPTTTTTAPEISSPIQALKAGDPQIASSLAKAGDTPTKKSGCIWWFAEILLSLLDKLSLKRLADWIRGKLGLLEKQKSDKPSSGTTGAREPAPTGTEEPGSSISPTSYAGRLKEKLLAQLAGQPDGAEKVEQFIEAFASYRAAKEKLSNSLPEILTKANHRVQKCLDRLKLEQLSLDQLVEGLVQTSSKDVDSQVLAKDLVRLLRLSAISIALQLEGSASDRGGRLLELVESLKWVKESSDAPDCLRGIWAELDQMASRTSAYYGKSPEQMREPLGGAKISAQLFAHMVFQANPLYPQELYQYKNERLQCMLWEILALAEMSDSSGTGWETTVAAAGHVRDLMLQLKEKNGPYRERKGAIESDGCSDLKKLRHEAKVKTLTNSKNDLRDLNTRSRHRAGLISTDELVEDSKNARRYLATCLRRKYFGALISTDELESVLMKYFLCADGFGHVCRGGQLSDEEWARLDAKFNPILLSIIDLYSLGGGLMGIKPHSAAEWNKLTLPQKEDLVGILQKGPFAMQGWEAQPISCHLQLHKWDLEDLEEKRNPSADELERLRRHSDESLVEAKWAPLGAELDQFYRILEHILESCVASWWRTP